MTDSIESAKNVSSTRYTERVMSVAASPAMRHRHEDKDDEFFRDRLDVSPQAHLANAPELIDISLEMIRALIEGTLPDEAVTALESFAPIGEMDDALESCDRVHAKGRDFITWEKTQSLAQALVFAAS